ncbi:hypothetical protein RHSIM_Rhsim01G0139900 [Rhododendron simsii]|uniref:Uncharacterized protein n=1 Tax=Rhododendron simsii TaxID=118357 RepID=A0A834HGR3_RHOSS|nr:hypothetical protein RHSIM_Rhsim01G0139900 [Rhododendron simsii]
MAGNPDLLTITGVGRRNLSKLVGKGIAGVADLKQLSKDKLGTGFSIMSAKRNPSLVTTFPLLSCGYLLSSFHKVKSVVLRTLNRARLAVAIDSFLKTGRVPTLQEGNMMESIFNFPWSKERPVVLGSRFKDAFQDPNSYLGIEPIFEKGRYVVMYNSSKGNIYALLKDQAKSDDILKAAFHLILMNLIKWSQLYMGLSRAKQQNSGNNSPVDLVPHAFKSYWTSIITRKGNTVDDSLTTIGTTVSDCLIRTLKKVGLAGLEEKPQRLHRRQKGSAVGEGMAGNPDLLTITGVGCRNLSKLVGKGIAGVADLEQLYKD